MLTENAFLLAAGDLNVVDYIKYAGTAGFAVMPFLAYWFMLRWNFRVGATNQGKAFNIVGALFSTILYSYYAYTEPNRSLLLANLYWFFVPAVLCTVAYFALYFLTKNAVAGGQYPWVVPLAMLQYITVLCMFAILATIVLKNKEYYLVAGKVMFHGEGLPGQQVRWSFKPFSEAKDGVVDLSPIGMVDQTDDDGRYLIGKKWKEMPEMKPQDLPPILVVEYLSAKPYQMQLDKGNHVHWNVYLEPMPAEAVK